MLCDDVRAAYEGACKNCKCPEIIRPVCGHDGHSYTNSCEAGCHKAVVVSEGLCQMSGGACNCSSDYTPVCAANGTTFHNYCEADCAGARVLRKGTCKGQDRQCYCSNFRNPVCGIDGKLYESPCFARCKDMPVDPYAKCMDVYFTHSHLN